MDGPHEPSAIATPAVPDLSQQSSGEFKFRFLTQRRKRAATACHRCRARKVKCGNEQPECTNCIRVGAQCVYNRNDEGANIEPANVLILRKLEDIQIKLDRIVQIQGSQSHPVINQSLYTTSQVHTTPNLYCDPAVKDRQPLESDSYLLETLQVPSSFSSTDSVLDWPIFEERFGCKYLADELFFEHYSSTQPESMEGQILSAKRSVDRAWVHEKDIIILVDKFLDFAHIKNPILDPDTLRIDARKVVEEGFGWDASSCVVALACALGAISNPFDQSKDVASILRHGKTSRDESADSRVVADTYYYLACKRLGLLGRDIVSCQCRLLVGVYLMYSMRPLHAWFAFHEAASTLSFYLKGQSASMNFGRKTGRLVPQDPRRRRLEQRLYWTCLKSECEIRTELDLPQSDLYQLDYPCLFPSPPEPLSSTASEILDTPASSSTRFDEEQSSNIPAAQRRGTEEQSWFYYLTEIALRRIENKVLNAFYREDHRSWSRENIGAMVRLAIHFEEELADWLASIPDPINFVSQEFDHNLDELRYMLRGRYLKIKALLYRPFLYFAIHSSNKEVIELDLNQLIEPLVQKALGVGMTIINSNLIGGSDSEKSRAPTRHRHHGTWFRMREICTISLQLIAARETVAGINWSEQQKKEFSGTLRASIEELRYWEAEAPDIALARSVIESLLHEIR